MGLSWLDISSVPAMCLALGALTLSLQLCDELHAHISLLQGSMFGAGLQTWAGRAPSAGFPPQPPAPSFLETCCLLLPSYIQVVAVQPGEKENLNDVQREGML